MELTNYLKNVNTEMHRVTWPTKKETRQMSLATIGILTAAGTVLWLLDTGIVAGLVWLSQFHA